MKEGLYYSIKSIKDWDSDRWPNFLPQELCCKCKGRYCRESYWHDDESMDALQELRKRMGKPLFITSGHRCPDWNRIQKGAPASSHLKIAFDIRLAGHDRFDLRDNALAVGFNGIGTAMTFLHVDIRPRATSWDYGAASREYWAQ